MSCEQLSKDVTYDNYDNIKSHKKPEFHPFSTVEGTFLEKALTPPPPPLQPFTCLCLFFVTFVNVSIVSCVLVGNVYFCF